MTYDKLIESILTAQEELLKHGIEANSVTLNGRKYGKLIENLPPNIKPTIFGMAVKAEYAMPDDYDFLVQHEQPQPQTNADCIRSMSDEELSISLCRCGCPPTAWDEHGVLDCPKPNEEVCEEVCGSCWLDWLKQEAWN